MFRGTVRLVAAAVLMVPVAGACQTMSMPASPAPAPTWPTAAGTVVLPDFHFGTRRDTAGIEAALPTLGTAHRNAAGHVDNAVLLLHGTGGNAHSLMNPVFSDVLFARARLSM